MYKRLFKESFTSITLRRINDAAYGVSLLDTLKDHFPYQWENINEAHLEKHRLGSKAYSPEYSNCIIFWLGESMGLSSGKDILLAITIGKKLVYKKGGIEKQPRVIGEPGSVDHPFGQAFFNPSQSVKQIADKATEAVTIDIDVLKGNYSN